MKKGFFQACQAADGPRTRYFNKPGDAEATDGNYEETEQCIAELTDSLRGAEAELRLRREERLRVEVERDAAAGGPTDASAQKSSVSRLPAELPVAALEALASHAEPPPHALQRLAESLMLLLEAEPLISLGDHPLPVSVPWRNLQLLLGRSAGRHPPRALAAALASEPHGPRLRVAIRERLLDGEPPLTREQVEAADQNCACIFDFVKAFVEDAPGEGGLRNPASEPLSDNCSSPSSRDDASTAVAAQEQEVSRLRRELRAARRRQQERSATATEAADRKPEDIQAKKEAMKEAQKLQEAEREAKKEAIIIKEVVQSVEYTLGVAEVQPLQDSVLYSMLNTLAEPRLACDRTVEITGFSEVREEAGVAAERSANVHEWLIDHGAAEEQLIVMPARSEEKRGSRRTEMKLIDRGHRVQDAAVNASRVSPDFDSIRDHGQALMRQGVVASTSTDKAEETLHPNPDAGLTESSLRSAQESEVAHGSAACAETEDAALAPVVLVEEVPSETADTGIKRLRVTFASPVLDASDAALELGERSVRLASASNSWREVEAHLPFIVDPATASAPRFSRKKGTLTLYLSSA